MKKLVSVLLSIFIMAASLGSTGVFAFDDVIVEIDGTKVDFDVNPQIIKGRTMVPLRKIFEEIGALVKWNDDTQTVSARKNSKTVSLVIGSDGLSIDKGKTDDNGNPIIETVTLDVPAQLLNGRTLVPVRAISESFGLNVDWDEKNKKVIILSDDKEDESWKENTGSINLSDLTYKGSGIEINKNRIKITAGGDYTLSGTLKDGNITVSTKEKVKLRLNGASITSQKDPCIFIEKADKAYITISDGTQNYLVAKDSDDGAIYSKENLEIKGGGTLNIESMLGHGIKASDNLVVENGTLVINATTDGIHINDTFKMTGGEINITAVCDGIDSESIVNILGGKINIETNGVPINRTNESNTATQNNRRPMWEEQQDVEFEKSTKGINAEWMMCISGGEIKINSASHAIHCGDEIEINGGEFYISSKYDKGISAHGNLVINGSETKIDIQKSTEGIESKNVLTINDGYIKINSADDAINATGGNSGAMMMPNFGANGDRQVPSDGFGRNNRQGNGLAGNGAGGNGGEMMMPNFGANGDRQVPSDDFRRNNRQGSDSSANSAGGLRRNENAGRKPANGNMNFDFQVPSDGEFVPPFGRENMTNQMPQGFQPNGEFMQPGGFNGFVSSDGFVPQLPQEPMGGRGNRKNCLIINGGYIEFFGGDDGIDANGNIVINAGTIKGTIASGSFYGNFGVVDADGTITIGENADFILTAQSGNANGLRLTQNSILVYCDNNHTQNDKITVSDMLGNIVAEYVPSGNYKVILVASQKLKSGEKYIVTVGDETFETSISDKNTVVGTQPSGGGFERGQGRR